MRTTIPFTCPVCGTRLPRAAGRCFFCESPLPRDRQSALTRGSRAARTPDRAELPRIYVPARDFGRLEILANIVLPAGSAGRDPATELLRRELERAIVCESAALPRVARVGSQVLVRDMGADGSIQKFHGILVWPHECHPRLPSIPVSSLIGAAILGLSSGDIMPYRSADGVSRTASVLHVFPEDGGPSKTEERQRPDRGDERSKEDRNVIRLVRNSANPRPALQDDPDDPPPAA